MIRSVVEVSIRCVADREKISGKWCAVDFGKALSAARVKAGMSQAAVAAAVGCKPANVGAIEVGRNSMVRDPGIVRRIEAAVGVERGDLLKHLPPDHPAHTYFAAEVAAAAPAKLPLFRLLPPGYSPGLDYAGRADGGDPQVQEADEDLQPYQMPKLPKGVVVVTVDGDSVSGYGVFDGDDLAVVRTLRKPTSGLVVYHSDEGFVVKQWENGQAWRQGPGDPVPVAVELTRSTRIFGVVVAILFGRRTGDVPKPPPVKRGRKA